MIKVPIAKKASCDEEVDPSGEIALHRERVPVEVLIITCKDCGEGWSACVGDITVAEVKEATKDGDWMLKEGVAPENHPAFDASHP